MSGQHTALLIQAREAIRQQDTVTARRLLQTAVHEAPQEYTAWLLLASITVNRQTALQYVEQAARLNPESPTVHKALAWARGRAAEIEPVDAPQAAPPASSRRRSPLWAAVPLLLLIVAAGWLILRRPAAPSPAIAAMPSLAAAETPDPNPPETSSSPAAGAPARVVLPATPTRPPTATPAPHIPAKQVNLSKEAAPRATWTMTPTPTPTPSPTVTPMPTFLAPQSGPISRPFGVSVSERWVDVNLTTQSLVAYEGDTPVLTTRISSGTWEFPTVTGQFRIYLTYQSQTMDGRRLGYDYYLEGVPYVMYFYKDYALHGTYWHNNFGTPMSHGCVNMKTADAGWLYGWASVGTLVNVHY